MQVAANSNRVGCAIIVGGGFGPLFTEQEHAEQVNWVKSIMEATEAGQVDELDLDPKWRDAILQANLYTQLAWTQALFTWPIIKPQNIHCSALVVAGSANQKSVENMKVFKTDMEDAGIQHAIVDGLDHAQEFSDPQSVLPIYHKFLQDYFI